MYWLMVLPTEHHIGSAFIWNRIYIYSPSRGLSFSFHFYPSFLHFSFSPLRLAALLTAPNRCISVCVCVCVRRTRARGGGGIGRGHKSDWSIETEPLQSRGGLLFSPGSASSFSSPLSTLFPSSSSYSDSPCLWRSNKRQKPVTSLRVKSLHIRLTSFERRRRRRKVYCRASPARCE